MSFLGALAGLSLSMDKAAYRSGEKPVYRVTGGPPGGQVTWTSYKDGIATGEYQAFYGVWLDEYGNAEMPAVQAWKDTDIGTWRKDVIVFPRDYPTKPLQNASVMFTVSGIPQTVYENTNTGAGGSGGIGDTISNFFEGDVNIAGMDIPKVALYGAAGLGVLLLLTSGNKGGGNESPRGRR